MGPASWQDWAPCLPRQVLPLWKALAGNTRLARKVLTLLYVKLTLRPPKERIRLSQQAELISLLVSSTTPPLCPPPAPPPQRNCHSGVPWDAGVTWQQRVSAEAAKDS